VSASAARGLVGRLRAALLEPEAPLSAFEVRTGSVGVVRLGREGGGVALRAAASLELPEGCLALSVSEANVKSPEAFQAAIASLAERVGLAEGGRVGLVLPDPVARVSLVPAAELRARRRGDLDDLIRFRLRRSVPFDIKESRVAHVEFPAGPGGEARSLVGAIALAVLDSYEAPLRALGLEPGLVELSGLALLRAAGPPAAGDELLVNWDAGYVSLLLTRDGRPLLLRTLTGEPASRAADVAREIANTVLYYRERLAGSALAGVRIRSGVRPLAETAPLVAEAAGVGPAAVAAWGVPGWDGAEAALRETLAGAAACVLGRTA
jgi:type IV pilus assembly protein PilM